MKLLLCPQKKINVIHNSFFLSFLHFFTRPRFLFAFLALAAKATTATQTHGEFVVD